jgi:hypothetical protein
MPASLCLCGLRLQVLVFIDTQVSWAVVGFPKIGGLSVLYCAEKNRSGQVRVRVTLRLTISQSVCLGIEPNLGQMTRVCFLLEISFRQLQVCNFVAPSLTRGRVCKLLYNCRSYES